MGVVRNGQVGHSEAVLPNLLPKRACVSACLLVLPWAAACGGDAASGAGGPPTDAAVAEFCATYVGGSQQALAEVDMADPDFTALTDAYQAWGERLEDVGTPSSIPDEARAGFEEVVASLAALTPEDMEAYWTSADAEASPFGGGASVDAFDAYAGETCGGSGSQTG